jgi:hypothetical protein
VVWRDDEFNLMRERNKRGMSETLREPRRQWSEMGF